MYIYHTQLALSVFPHALHRDAPPWSSSGAAARLRRLGAGWRGASASPNHALASTADDPENNAIASATVDDPETNAIASATADDQENNAIASATAASCFLASLGAERPSFFKERAVVASALSISFSK